MVYQDGPEEGKADVRAERQALREREAEDVKTGRKTRAQVKREREIRRAREQGTLVRPLDTARRLS